MPVVSSLLHFFATLLLYTQLGMVSDIEPVTSHQTQVTIQGVAKEGLIKQHAGEKVTRLVAQRIREIANE